MIPKYKQYKESGVDWIGSIPEGWTISQYKFEADVQNGFAFKSELFDKNKGFPILRIRDITSGQVSTFYKGDFSEEYVVTKNDLLIGMDGDYNIRWWDKENVLLNQRCCRVIEKNMTSRRFLYYSLPFNLKIINDLTYFTTVKHLSSGDILNAKFPCPTPEEQTKIAKYLDHQTRLIDAIIEKKQQLIEKLKEQRQAIINEAVTKGLDPAVPMKDSGVEWLGEIPEHWTLTSVKNVLSIPITDGPHTTPELIDDGIPFISAEAIKNGEIDFRRKRGYISKEENEIFSKKYTPELDDIFMVKSGATTGNIAMVKTNEIFNIWSPLAVFRAKRGKIIPQYLFFFLQSTVFKYQVELNWSYGTQQNIGMGVLSNLKISFPEANEQMEIISILNTEIDRIDNLIQPISLTINKLKNLRQSLISEAVTGKIDVREWEPSIKETA